MRRPGIDPRPAPTTQAQRSERQSSPRPPWPSAWRICWSGVARPSESYSLVVTALACGVGTLGMMGDPVDPFTILGVYMIQWVGGFGALVAAVAAWAVGRGNPATADDAGERPLED